MYRITAGNRQTELILQPIENMTFDMNNLKGSSHDSNIFHGIFGSFRNFSYLCPRFG